MAKIASKNNPTTREKAFEYFHQGRKIKPSMLISKKHAFIIGEYDDSSDPGVGADGAPIPWGMITKTTVVGK